MTGLIIDLFAGGGGASEGIRQALGRDPDIAVNHDAVAIAMHTANHPGTEHFQGDVWKVHPLVAMKGRPVSILWASPDCKHFSRAKGSAPRRDKNIRSLAWVVVKWARLARQRVICLENVEEFKTWGPLDGDGKIIDAQKGLTFRTFLWQLRNEGYQVEYRCLRACDYGAPTIRKRLFLIARRDGMPIVWPEPSHGDPKSEAVLSGRLLSWRTAAECIDWSLPCPSIFDRKKPLAENTLKRIAEGIRRYVIETAEPFIVTYYGPKRGVDFRGFGLDSPIPTQTTENRFGLVAPYLARIGQTGGGGKYCNDTREPLTTITTKAEHLLMMPHLQRQFGNSVGHAADDPLGTITAGGSGKTALVAAFLSKHYTGVIGTPLHAPISTVTSVDHHSLTTSHLLKLRGTCRSGQDMNHPMPTVTAGGTHVGEVRVLLVKYYGTGVGQPLTDPAATITSKDRLGLVTVMINGESYVISDIGMRMLQPHELFLAQGFPPSYVIDIDVDGKRITKSDQVRMVGNSVCPPMARALVEANVAGMVETRRRNVNSRRG